MVENEQLDNLLKKKYEDLMLKYNEISEIVGIQNLSYKFILQEPLFKEGLKIKREIEQNSQSMHKTSKNDFELLMDNFKEIRKTLEEKQKIFGKEQIFGQREIEQINRVINYYDKYSPYVKIIDKTLNYAENIDKITEEFENIEQKDFDKQIDEMEKVLNKNDALITDIKGQLQGDFLKLLESF